MTKLGQSAAPLKNHTMAHCRYRWERNLAQHGDRRLDLAHDLWTDQSVVLKRAPLVSAILEAGCLLSLPEGIGPRLAGLHWDGSQELLLVQECLEGETLEALAARNCSDCPPEIVARIGDLLARLHETCWVHSDLHPGNIVVAQDGGSFRIRFVDFGFAIDRFAAVDAGLRGGASNCLAPEVVAGWTVDGRADLFSVGKGIANLWPHLRKHPNWKDILGRLTETQVMNRYSDAVAFHDEVVRTFHLKSAREFLRPLGGGHLVGRQEDLDHLLQCLSPETPARILVQARPHTGLTRFLLEAVLRAARTRESAVSSVNLTDLQEAQGFWLAIEFLRTNPREALICGVSDASPGFRWLPQAQRDGVTSTLSSGSWTRRRLLPLGREAYREKVALDTGARGPAGEFLADVLHRETEGDLRLLVDGIQDYLEWSGIECEPRWNIDLEQCRAWARHWIPPAPEPELDGLPADLTSALRVCARIGFSFPQDVATHLFLDLGCKGSPSALTAYGLLIEEGTDRFAFATNHLWSQANATISGKAEMIDRWLCGHYAPDPTVVDDVLQACRAYRTCNEKAQEVACLSQALSLADQDGRWSDCRRLLFYPDPVPETWSAEVVLHRVGGLAELLCPRWSRQQLLTSAGIAVNAIAPKVGVELLELAANGTEPEAAARALIPLINRVADQPDHPDFRRYMRALKSVTGEKGGPKAGIVQYYAARGLLGAGRPREALQTAQAAEAALEGSGIHQVFNLQLLAAMLFGSQPKAAIESLKSAVEIAQTPELEAQLRYNLALAYGRLGKFDLAEQCTDQAVAKLGSDISPGRLLGLRIQRSWARADLDRTDAAQREVDELLQSPHVRLTPHLLVPALLLQGCCYRHRGTKKEAIRHILLAWKVATTHSPVALQLDCLQVLLDTLLDLRAWNLVRSYAAELVIPVSEDAEASVRAVGARLEAVRAQALGDASGAVIELEAGLASARELNDPVASARYLLHLGSVQLEKAARDKDPKSAHSSVELHKGALKKLTPPGRGYIRAHTLIGLAAALQFIGNRTEALDRVTEAVELAKQIQCSFLIVRGLEARARLRMDGAP